MQIEHLALWVQDLDAMKNFYVNYFEVAHGPEYSNPDKQFVSYFIYFGQGKTRLELMTRPDIRATAGERGFGMGLAHFAISVGGRERVNALTERLRMDNYTIYSEPRVTGDGCYESVVLDPEGNYVEISA
ncbi:MAG TPA: VOC family protein [Puia sp.]|jgi:lactoylglutathione lyase|nr:VOC family protein [Puia sp.]